MKKGFSVIEVMLAAALFIIFGGGIISLILQSFDANRTGNEETIATEYATEGLEAVRSIKNQDFSNLIDTTGTGIIASASGTWKFSGSNNTLTKYTRILNVSDVSRDGSGNIVSTGGTLDINTKKVTSTVTWNVTPTRNDSVVLSTYFTSWKSSTQASSLSINTSSVARDHKNVIGITLQNTASSPIVLTSITPTWTQTTNSMVSIEINGIIVWTGSAASNTIITLSFPVTIAANSSTIPVNFLQMTGNILSGENWTVGFGMNDGSQNSVSFTTP